MRATVERINRQTGRAAIRFTSGRYALVALAGPVYLDEEIRGEFHIGRQRVVRPNGRHVECEVLASEISLPEALQGLEEPRDRTA